MNHSKDLIIPCLDPDVIEFAKSLSCTWLGAVHVTPKHHCKMWNCHNNTITYTEWYGGQRLLGYYLLKCLDSGRLLAILHSIVRKESGELMDITPFDDNRTYNMFAILRDQTPDYSVPEVWSSNTIKFKKGNTMQADIYTKTTCPYCVRAKKLLTQLNIPYTEYVIRTDRDTMPLMEGQIAITRDVLLERAPDVKTVPQIWIDGRHVGGCEDLEAEIKSGKIAS